MEKSRATAVTEALEVLEAERMVETVKLRSALVKAAAELLPEAIRQAKPQGTGKGARPGSPALLRLIARLAMRPAQIDKPRK